MTVCTGRALRHHQLKHLAQLVIFTLWQSSGVVFVWTKVTSFVHPERMGQPRWSAHETMQKSRSQAAGNDGAWHCSQGSRDNSCVSCDQADDWQSLMLELTDKVERLRSISKSEEQTEWWSHTLLHLRQMHPLPTSHEAMDPPSSHHQAAGDLRDRGWVATGFSLWGDRWMNPLSNYFTFHGALIQHV